MEFVIYLLRKTFRGGEHREYVLAPKESSLDEIMEEWGERSDGGHGYGYTVYCDETIEKPTKEIVEYLTKKLNKEVEYLQKSIDFYKTKIEFLNIMSNRKLPKNYREVYERIKSGDQLFEHGEFGPDGKKHDYQFMNGDKVEPKIINYLMDRCYLKRGNIEIDYQGGKNFKYEIKVNI